MTTIYTAKVQDLCSQLRLQSEVISSGFSEVSNAARIYLTLVFDAKTTEAESQCQKRFSPLAFFSIVVIHFALQ